MALPPDKFAAIHALVDDVDDVLARVTAVASFQSAEELQYLANYYNWDDGFALPTAIASHPKCDLGVALNLFWLAEGICLLTKEVEPDEYNRDWVAFCQLVSGRILEGYYQRGQTSYQPPTGVARIYSYRKQGVPEILLQKVEGTV
jgi:hypothetical protein